MIPVHGELIFDDHFDAFTMVSGLRKRHPWSTEDLDKYTTSCGVLASSLFLTRLTSSLAHTHTLCKLRHGKGRHGFAQPLYHLSAARACRTSQLARLHPVPLHLSPAWPSLLPFLLDHFYHRHNSWISTGEDSGK